MNLLSEVALIFIEALNKMFETGPLVNKINHSDSIQWGSSNSTYFMDY